MNVLLFVEVNGDKMIRRVPVSADLQEEISTFLVDQKNEFFSGQDKVQFSGCYNADDGEIYSITDYQINNQAIEALENPLNYEPLDPNEDNLKVKALFAGEWNGETKYICFQVMDSRKVLAKSFALLFSGNTYTKLNNPGIILQDALTALYENNELLFYSYHNTRRFLDLSEYYKEATDADIELFSQQQSIRVDNVASLINESDSIIRKKVALLLKNDVMQNLDVDNISQVAQEYSINVNIDNGQIVVPDTRKEIKELVRFLDEDYFTAPITKRKCLTNSKQYIA